MEKIILQNKEIKIRKISKDDLKNVDLFLDYINSLVEEGAKISIKKKKTTKEEIEYLKVKIKNIKDKKEVFLLAEHNNKIIAMTEIRLLIEIKDHIGLFSIGVIKNYRNIGLGTYLANQIIEIAKKELKPSLKIIQLKVFLNNKIAISFYRKMGFKIVAKLPKQVQYKKRLVDEFIMNRKINISKI